MKKTGDPKTDLNNLAEQACKHTEPSVITLIALVALYLLVYSGLTWAAHSENVIMIRNNPLPVSAFAGVFSSLSNILIIIMVVIFRKKGFAIALVLLVLQFPSLLQGIFIAHNPTSIPGFFSYMFSVLAVIFINYRNIQIDGYQTGEIRNLIERQQFSQQMFEQTAAALVNAIDAKDTYSHGHSLRVAEYSERIARKLGKSDEECYQIYYSALLHDVGKIGIEDNIINKNGKLTKEEYEVIKQHPVMGYQILSTIKQFPYLHIGAHYHHERYDGKGYPDGLKGEDIPEIARIISVADAYDAMSSNRSYRSAIPQQLVREEIVKGAGTQFDPRIAIIMQQLIDVDTEYRMKEWIAERERNVSNDLNCKEMRGVYSDGYLVTSNPTRIHLKYRPAGGSAGVDRLPVMVLFDSLDGRVYTEETLAENMNYFEYGEVWFDGHVTEKGIRKSLTQFFENDNADKIRSSGDGIDYDIEAVRVKDHVLLKIDNGLKTVAVTIALPDSTRYSYISFTGENCDISDLNIEVLKHAVGEDYITRIADEISYIDGPTGDMPNLQVDGHRSAYTDGIPLVDGLKISFHTMSLPIARLIWHCPYVILYRSSDGRVNGNGYHEYNAVRLDGENIDGSGGIENMTIVRRTDDFKGWDEWKNSNKEGFDCTITFGYKENEITLITENQGLYVMNTGMITDGGGNLFVSLTGDQCALTNIRVS